MAEPAINESTMPENEISSRPPVARNDVPAPDEAGLKPTEADHDGSGFSQPMGIPATPGAASQAVRSDESGDPAGPPNATRHRLPNERSAVTHHFSVGGHEGYLTVGFYPNGRPGEIFIRMAKAGSTIAGLMECFGTVVSIGLQHGVPLKVLCDKLSHTRFEPSGWTGNGEIGYAKSIMDYLFRWMELRFLSGEQMPMFTPMQATERERRPESNPTLGAVSTFLQDPFELGNGPVCRVCGALMIPNGSCYRCANCGGTSGCS